MSTPAEAAERDFQKLIQYLGAVAMAVRLGGFRPTQTQRETLAEAIKYLGKKIAAQHAVPAVEQPAPRRPSIIQQGPDKQADFLRAANRSIE